MTTVHYPWGEQPPLPGQDLLLQPGLHWLRMPLPFALDHINVWMLDDHAGTQPAWSLVDTGVATDEVRQAWRNWWQTASLQRPLHRVIATHMHPDHLGNAQWLLTQHAPDDGRVHLWMSPFEHAAALLARAGVADQSGGESVNQFMASHGLQSTQDRALLAQRSGYFARLVPDLPPTARSLREGMLLQVGQRQWRCMVGLGHSPEHISLFDAEHATLISGDMLLPRISTNVSVLSLRPEDDPLAEFLRSIASLTALPHDTLVLPSHGLPFRGLHARVAQLQQHHQERLEEVLKACATQPSTAAELLGVLFKRQLDAHQTLFAMGESIAHLNHLWHQGALTRERDAQGVWRFGRTA